MFTLTVLIIKLIVGAYVFLDKRAQVVFLLTVLMAHITQPLVQHLVIVTSVSLVMYATTFSNQGARTMQEVKNVNKMDIILAQGLYHRL